MLFRSSNGHFPLYRAGDLRKRTEQDRSVSCPRETAAHHRGDVYKRQPVPPARGKYPLPLGNCVRFPRCGAVHRARFGESLRFLYKGIIIKHNKTEPTYTKTSLFLCEKRRFLWPGLRKEGNLFKLAGPGGLAFFHLTKKEVSKWPMKK